jgi:hypothetical protein
MMVPVVGSIVSMYRSISKWSSLRVIVVAIDAGCIESAIHLRYSAANTYKFDARQEGCDGVMDDDIVIIVVLCRRVIVVCCWWQQFLTYSLVRSQTEIVGGRST